MVGKYPPVGSMTARSYVEPWPQGDKLSPLGYLDRKNIFCSHFSIVSLETSTQNTFKQPVRSSLSIRAL